MRTPKRYTIENGVLKFKDKLNTFGDYLKVPEGVFHIDFNDLEHLLKPLDLRDSSITYLDLGKLIMVNKIYLPDNLVYIKENLYYAEKITSNFPHLITIESARMKHCGVYDNRPLIYLSGTVRGHLELREQQRRQLIDKGFAVYSPGNHITFGDPVADKYPDFVAAIDTAMLNRCSHIVFDLATLSPGTCGELGWVIGSKAYTYKKISYFNLNTNNFFINGLVKPLERVNDIGEVVI